MKKIIFILTLFSFAAGFFILKSVLPTGDQIKETSSVPLPSKTDETLINLNQNETIGKFFSLINDGNIEEILPFLHSKIIPDNEAKNNWLKQFSVLKSITVNSITKLNADEEIYRVQLTIDDLAPNATDAAIPNYGWNKGENVRWISLEKENDLWKISQIATGP